MIEYERFLPQVLPHVGDCPEIVAVEAIRNSVIKFCEQVNVWKETMDEVTVVAGTPDYELDIPADTSIVRVTGATLDGKNIDPFIESELEEYGSDWRTDTGTVKHYTMIDNVHMLLYKIPEEAPTTGLIVTAVLKPSRTSFQILDIFLEDYYETIAFGAKGEIFAITGQAWYDPNESKNNWNKFDAGVSMAKLKHNKGHTNAKGSLNLRKFA